LRIASLLVLVIGLSVAVGIYFFAPERDENLAMYEVTSSKQYNRTLQRFGGKASVLFDEFQTWFAARWQGKQLGVTIGWLAVGAAGVLYLLGRATRR
jgi:hypothetical protein